MPAGYMQSFALPGLDTPLWSLPAVDLCLARNTALELLLMAHLASPDACVSAASAWDHSYLHPLPVLAPARQLRELALITLCVQRGCRSGNDVQLHTNI